MFFIPTDYILVWTDTETHNSLSLKERKTQWLKEEEERKRNAPDPAAPAGHTLMPENERKEMLHSLKECMLFFVSFPSH